MPRTAIGLDIGTSAVRAAEVTVKGPPTLLRFAQVALPAGAVVDGEVTQPDAVAAAIKELWDRGGFRARRAAIAVANQKVVVREIPLPFMEEDELRGALRFQVQEYIPIPIEDAILDFQVLEEFPGEEDARMMRVLIVAAHREMVNAFVAALQGAGIEPVGIDLAPFAALRAILDPVPSVLAAREAEAVVDIGGGVTSIVVHEQGTPRFVRIIPSGGTDITEALVAALGLTPEQAERQKMEIGLPPEGVPPTEGPMRIIEQRAASFLGEVGSSLEYYQGQPGTVRVERVLVIGAGARLPRLLDRMSGILHLPVEEGRPLAHVRLGKLGLSPEQLEQLSSVAAVAVGLALGDRT